MGDKHKESAPPDYNAAIGQVGGMPPYPMQHGGPSPYPVQQGGPAPYPMQPQAPGYPPQGFQYPGQPGMQGTVPAAYPQGPYLGQGPNPQWAQGAAVHNAGIGGVIQGGYDSDVEGGRMDDPSNPMNSFGEKAVRRNFIKKVYGILMCQLIATGVIMSIFMFVEPVKEFSRRNQYLYWVAVVITLVCIISMACCEGVRRKSPMNFIFLSIFTLAEGFMLGTLAAHFDVEAVIIAVGICAGVTLALTLFAFQTKYDFTTCGGMLCAMLMILIIAGFIVAFFPGRLTMILYGSAGALIFSMYIVYDTQLMMGGNHKYALSPEEYIFAALNLYLDIINLFMYILTIISAAKSG